MNNIFDGYIRPPLSKHWIYCRCSWFISKSNDWLLFPTKSNGDCHGNTSVLVLRMLQFVQENMIAAVYTSNSRKWFIQPFTDQPCKFLVCRYGIRFYFMLIAMFLREQSFFCDVSMDLLGILGWVQINMLVILYRYEA